MMQPEIAKETKKNDDRHRKRILERLNYLIYVVIAPGNVCCSARSAQEDAIIQATEIFLAHLR